MAYRFKLKETLQEGARRIACEQLTTPLDATRASEDRVLWVHETRKSIKRIRALLRLLRSGLAPASWKAENADLRDIARMLSPLRDRDVLRMTLPELGKAADPPMKRAIAWFEGTLGPSPAEAGEHEPDTIDIVAESQKRLEAARDRLGKLTVSGEIAWTVGQGLAATQREGRLSIAVIAKAPTDTHIHDLRKIIQTVWRQSLLVEPAWPRMQQTRAGVARGLSQQMGDMQDLAMLIEAVDKAASGTRARRHADVLIAASRARQAELMATALPEAERLFAIRPKALAAEITALWEVSARSAAATARKRQRKLDTGRA